MYCSSFNVSSVDCCGSPQSSWKSLCITSSPWKRSMDLSNNGQGVICGSGCPVRSAVDIIAVLDIHQTVLYTVVNLLMTARMSPWKFVSSNLVRRKNALDQEGSRCSIVDMRCDSAIAICLVLLSIRYRPCMYPKTHDWMSRTAKYRFAGHFPRNENCECKTS
jgi:hypothetical protein